MTPGIIVLLWIIGSSILMCILALVGVLTLSLSEKTLQRLLLPLVALAAGSLLGGAFFHMIPESVEKTGASTAVYIYVVAGFAFFLLLEQLLHWHHCHREDTHCKKPLTYLILIGDGIHNFIGGIAVAGTFLIDIRLILRHKTTFVKHINGTPALRNGDTFVLSSCPEIAIDCINFKFSFSRQYKRYILKSVVRQFRRYGIAGNFFL